MSAGINQETDYYAYSGQLKRYDTTAKIIIKTAKIIWEVLAKEVELKNETHFFNDLGMDSVDFITMIMAVEKEFDISICDEEAEKIETFGQLIEYISEIVLK